jgi:hypothetical protein
LFISEADDLEEEVCAFLVDGQEAQLVDDEKSGPGVFFQLLVYPSLFVCRGQGVDKIDSGCKKDGVVFKACGIAQGRGQMGFSEPYAAEEDDVGLVFDKVEPEEILDLEPIDFFGPGPVELIQGFDEREASHTDAAFYGSVPAQSGLATDEVLEVIHMCPVFPGRLCGQVLVVVSDKREFEVF